jgi:mannosyltransferase OCH1-like enzyme
MNTPLGSPTLAVSAAKFRNKVPTQVKRCLPLYLACAFLFLLIVNFDVFFLVPSPVDMLRREKTPSFPGSTFPQKIWQTWKTDPLMFGIRDTVRAMTWLEKNPHMRYEVITDASDVTYVEQHFGPNGFNRPDIVEFYRSVKLPIVKADLLRYMVMYAEGGVYADIDVEAVKPFTKFFPERHDEKDFDMIAGVEVDEPSFRDHPILGQKSQSFCQWTIISRPQQPAFLRLVENIMGWLKGIAKQQGVSLDKVQLDFDQVISGTGPSAFTKVILEEMNKKSKQKVTWDTFHDMDESKVVGRVLVLTVEAFCAGQGHSNSGNHGSQRVLVKHHYHASNWPSRHPRYNHPAYGQVEECNWNAACVAQWDKNVAEYKTLSEEEKRIKIEERVRFLESLGK